MGGSSKKTTVGYKYYLGMHMVLCHGPVDNIRQIKVDDRIAWTGLSGSGRVNIDKPSLFGGEAREGGISGALDFALGEGTQTPNDYLQSRLGNAIPAFRGVVNVILRQMWLGNNPYLKRWDFKAQRVNVRQDGIEQWYKAKAPIGSLEPMALYFALDFSGSMHDNSVGGKTRLQHQKEAVVAALEAIQNVIDSGFNERIDIMVVSWGTAPDVRASISFTNVSSANIDSIISWVNSNTTRYSTYFPCAFLDAETFFNNAESGAKKLIIFTTDGEPADFNGDPPQQITDDAKLLLDNLSTDPDVYTYNIILEDTTYTAQLDNTPDDGVPVISFDDGSDELANAILAAISGQIDLNPAHIIRECLTDPDWGMGYADSDIDDTSFTAAANTLFTEVMGISLLWDRQTSIESFITEIIRHIDGVLFVDRTTGQFVLKLIRDDYDEGSLLVFDEGNITKLESLSRPTFGELTNSVSVNYWDAGTEENASVTVQDTALVQMQNATINTTLQYPGFTNKGLATRVAMRDLKALSTPLWTCTLFTNQTAKDLELGDAFKLSWDDYGLSEVIMRVTGIAYGDGKNNQIRIQATQDVFGTPTQGGVGVPNPEDGWIPPDTTPSPCPVRVITETPYYELVVQQGQITVDDNLTANPDLGFLMAAGSRPPADGMINASVLVDAGSGYVEGDTLDFSPAAFLNEAVNKTQTVWLVSGFVDIEEVTLGTFAQIGNEIVRIDTVSSNNITVGRGVLDTVPEDHPNGTAILFWDNFPSSDEVDYVASEQLDVKLLPTSGSSSLPEGSAPADSLTFTSRAIRPYPPGNFRINGNQYPTEVGIADIVLTWAHRDRTQQTDGNLYDQSFGNIGPETNTTYTVVVKDNLNNTLRTEAGITATTYTYTEQFLNDDTGGNIPDGLQIELYSVRDTYDSFQRHNATFDLVRLLDFNLDAAPGTVEFDLTRGVN